MNKTTPLLYKANSVAPLSKTSILLSLIYNKNTRKCGNNLSRQCGPDLESVTRNDVRERQKSDPSTARRFFHTTRKKSTCCHRKVISHVQHVGARGLHELRMYSRATQIPSRITPFCNRDNVFTRPEIPLEKYRRHLELHTQDCIGTPSILQDMVIHCDPK